MAVAEDLHLDMAGPGDHLFQVALAVAEGGLGFAAAFQHLFLQLLGVGDGAHAAPAAAPGGLEHEREADLFGLLGDGVEIIAQHVRGGNDRHAGLDRDLAGGGLVAKRAHRGGLGADEGDAGFVAGIDEIGVFREQPVARMDRVGAGHLGDADDLFDAQIGGDGAQPFADAVGLVRLEAMQAQLVFFGVDGDGFLPHLVGRPHDPDGDFATVGNQDFLEVGHGVFSM